VVSQWASFAWFHRHAVVMLASYMTCTDNSSRQLHGSRHRRPATTNECYTDSQYTVVRVQSRDRTATPGVRRGRDPRPTYKSPDSERRVDRWTSQPPARAHPPAPRCLCSLVRALRRYTLIHALTLSLSAHSSQQKPASHQHVDKTLLASCLADAHGSINASTLRRRCESLSLWDAAACGPLLLHHFLLVVPLTAVALALIPLRVALLDVLNLIIELSFE